MNIRGGPLVTMMANTTTQATAAAIAPKPRNILLLADRCSWARNRSYAARVSHRVLALHRAHRAAEPGFAASQTGHTAEYTKREPGAS